MLPCGTPSVMECGSDNSPFINTLCCLSARYDLNHLASEKCASRMVEREAKKRPPSVYQVGETVLIRYPGTGSKLVKKRYVLEAKVFKRNLEKDLYQVSFSSPISGKKTNKWMSVCN